MESDQIGSSLSHTLDDDKVEIQESKLYRNVNGECPHTNRIKVNRGLV